MKISPVCILLFVGLLCASLLKAQNKYPPRLIEEPKRKACFLFALGESPFNTGVKVMIVSTNIYRQKYEDYHVFDDYGNASQSYYSHLLGAFSRKLREVEFNEFYLYTTATGNVLNGNIIFRPEVVESYWQQVRADGFCPTSYTNKPGVSYTSTADFSENCRDRLIEEKRKEGYKVFQMEFDEFYQKIFDHGDYKLFTEIEFNASKDEVKGLSPLYVEVYRSSIIQNLAGYKAKNSNSSSSSATKKKQTSSDEKKETQAEFDARMNLYRMQARSLETKGDEYYKLGSLFYKQAYDCYKASYKIYAFPSVQKKLSDMDAMMSLAKAVDKFGKKVDDFVFSLDPEGKTNYTHGFIQYNGLLGSSGQVNSFDKYRLPTDIWFGITGQRLFLSYQVRMGYIQTGNTEINVRQEYRNYSSGTWSNGDIVDTILVNNAGFGIGVSGGINIPIKKFQVYGLYGYEMRVGLAGKIYSDAFNFEEKKDGNDLLPMFQSHLEAGVLWLIPKTKMGLGLNYNMLSIRTSSNTEIKNTSLIKRYPTAADAAGNNRYYLNSFTSSKYKFGTLGLKFFWMLN